jgi:hypothetical protein
MMRRLSQQRKADVVPKESEPSRGSLHTAQVSHLAPKHEFSLEALSTSRGQT